MKNILFYGDSNTWGFDPSSCTRYPYEYRWTSICANELGDGYTCIPAGMNGRTTVFDDPFKGCRNGNTALDYELQTHKPLDLAVVMLGTNDLKYTDGKGSAEGMEKILTDILTVNERFDNSYPVFPDKTSILLISPVEVMGDEWFGNDEASSESKKLSHLYKEIVDLLNERYHADNKYIYFLDATKYTPPSQEDGVHLSKEGHSILAKAVSDKIKEIFCR